MKLLKWSSKQSGSALVSHSLIQITRLAHICVLVVLLLIWCAELTYFPTILSGIFACMWASLFWSYKQQNSMYSVPIEKRLKKQKIQQILKITLTLAALLTIWLNYGTFWGVEAGTASLATFLYAKSLETKTSRDYIVLFNFALFVSASLFLHSQSVMMAIMVLLCLIGCLTGLYQLQIGQYVQSRQVNSSLKSDVLHVSKVIALAIPFFLLLFMFFPRFPPLWQIPISSQKGVTGISDRMSPGDIAELSQSSALAFRITGDLKKLPTRQNLYWRAMVLDQYDGQTWTSQPYNQRAFKEYFDVSSQNVDSFKYQYLAADDRSQWIVGLETSVPTQNGFQLNVDGAIVPTKIVQRTQPIQLHWIGEQPPTQKMENQFIQTKNIAFKPQYDLKSQQLAQQLWVKAQQQPEKYVRHVLEWYQQNNFSYTLTPGVLGQNRVDDFLFRSRKGFCEHYASSFVMLMRYVRIPARVVVGYQGGQVAPDGRSWEVRQMDAHAWTEVQLNGRWQRVDPTFIVAPNRIDQGMQDLLQNDRTVFGGDGSGTWQYRQFNTLKTLRIWSDYASYQWQSKVVGYDVEKQNNWMKKLGLTSSYSFGLGILGGLLLLGGLYFLVIQMKGYLSSSRLERVLKCFSARLDKSLQRKQAETFEQWMLRLSQFSEKKQLFEQANTAFQQIVYMPSHNKFLLKQLDVLLKQCAVELRSSKSTCQGVKK